ncbi:PH and SEC7 domain-containing protein 1 isoform X3 [Strongylocentrotus purpuratus]|nr:PH and SEC7 domain-containing protein 1 isoform X3 [Strongylocentrotus purpuratus]
MDMEGGGCSGGVTPKILHLQRALSGGFGFSLMGGRGTGFPPVICDILSDSPASECEGMQVGDIILEINNETMENKSTKEVVTALMKSPDDLILKVREDLATRDRVLKFLAPLDKSPSSQHRAFKTTSIISPKPKIEKRDFTKVNSDRVVCTSGDLNGLEAGVGESDSSPDLSERLRCAGASNGETEELRGLQSPVLPNRTGFDNELRENGVGEIKDHLVTPKSNGLDASQPTDSLVNSHSCNSDADATEEFVGQILTTTALIHREDSLKEGGLSPAKRLDTVEEGRKDVLDGCVQSNTVLADPEVVRETDLTVSSAETDTTMNNGHSTAELVRITSHQLPTTFSHSQDVRTRIENGTNVSYNNDTMSSPVDSAFVTSSPIVKVKTTATTVSLGRNTPSEVQVKSVQQPMESSRPKLSTNAIGIQTNPSDLEPRIENGGLKGKCELSAAMAAPTAGQTMLGNGGNIGSVDLPSLTPRDRESTSSSGSDDYEFPDMNTLESALHENPKNLDLPSAKRLAKRLYELDGFKREDVSIHLSKRNEFCKLVAREYLSYFDFTGDRLDEALREFLRCVTVIGESQERERVLAHFSHRYFDCNPGVVESSDAAHTLICAVMLLNTDLHGQNIGKKMSLNAFVTNLEGMNDGMSFPRSTLKALYNAIKAQPLEWIMDDDDARSDVSSTGKGSKKLPRNGTPSGNPLVQIDDDPNAPVYIQTYVMRKLVTDAEGKKTPKGKRGWKMYFGTVKGLCIYLHKSEVAKDLAFNNPKEVMRIQHALASRSGQYDKKPNVFLLRLANWSEYLMQCLDVRDMQSWMQAVNLASSVHSSPPLPAAVGSQMGFRRPVLPSGASKQDPAQQLASHDEKIEALERELEDHRSYPPDKKAKAKIIKDYKTKDEYLEYEISRFKTYIYLLRSQPFSSLPPRSAPPAPSSSSSVAQRSSPAPVPKFASSHSSSTLSRSASAPNSLPKFTSSSSSSLSKSSSSVKSPSSSDGRKSPEGNSSSSKPILRKTNSNAGGSHSDPAAEESQSFLRDSTNKV